MEPAKKAFQVAVVPHWQVLLQSMILQAHAGSTYSQTYSASIQVTSQVRSNCNKALLLDDFSPLPNGYQSYHVRAFSSTLIIQRLLTGQSQRGHSDCHSPDSGGYLYIMWFSEECGMHAWRGLLLSSLRPLSSLLSPSSLINNLSSVPCLHFLNHLPRPCASNRSLIRP